MLFAWKILINYAVVHNIVDRIRDLITKTKNWEIINEKNKCKEEFPFNYLIQKESFMDLMMCAYLAADTDSQLEWKKKLDNIRDEIRCEEVAYLNFVKKRLDIIRKKWDSIRSIISNFENTESKFSLNNFVFSSNRAARAKIIDDESFDLEENLCWDNSAEIECVVCMEKAPAVLWLKQLDDTNYSTSDYCIDFPLASHPELQKILVNNPVCGHCANSYLKYSKVSAYREPITGYIPTNWQGKTNMQYVQNFLCKIISGQKQLHHVKLLLISILDDCQHKWLEFKEQMLLSMVHNVYTNDTLSDEGTKRPLIEVIGKIINDEEKFLRQPFSACMRILSFCHKLLKTDKNIIIDLVRKRLAYLLIEVYCNRTKHGNIDEMSKELESMCFETSCGIPLEGRIKSCSIIEDNLISFINNPSTYNFLERICVAISIDKNQVINDKYIVNILWHLQQLNHHERPWTVYTNLMQNQKLFRSIGCEPSNFFDIINQSKFGKYKKTENKFIPSYAFYNGEYSGPSKFYFGEKALWNCDWENCRIDIKTVSEYLRLKIKSVMSDKYGSYYPNANSTHTLLHSTIARILETKFPNTNEVTDLMILECVLALAGTNGNYGNIYTPGLLFEVANLIKLFCQMRQNCVNRSTGRSSIDKTFEHKVKSELLECGMVFDGDVVIFEPTKLRCPTIIYVDDLFEDSEMRNRIEQLYLSNKMPTSEVADKLVSYHSDLVIVIGDANTNIETCSPQWELEQKDMLSKISLINSPTLSNIKYIGGADISWDKNNTDAVACLVVHEYPSLKLVVQLTIKCKVHIPYKAGFLAFREVPIYLKLVDILHESYSEYVPQVMLIDGNGVWHPRGCGSATHFSILSGIPAIGVSKNVLFVDSVGKDDVQELLEYSAKERDTSVKVVDSKGQMLGYAYNSSGSTKKAIYISAGNMISQEKSLEIVRSVNRYRISETIRSADKISRLLLAD